MRPKIGKRSPMNGVADITRNAAAALVDREERRTGSRMVAYEIVAQTVGTSAEWIRKFISSNEAKEPRMTVGFNLIQVYRQVCERVEQAGDRERQLKEDIDAALESAGLLVAPATGTNSGAGEASRHRTRER
jgi:hypothetical protein